MNIGEYIKKLREDRGLSLNMLAIKAGVSNATISHIENGRNKPSLATLQLLAKALNTDVDKMISVMKGEEIEVEIDSDEIPRDKEALIEYFHKNPELKILFSLSEDLTPENIEFLIQMAKKLKGD